MNWLLFSAGALVVLWFIIEGLWTTLWVDGHSAPVTGRLTSWLWKFWKAVFKGSHKALSLAGPMVLTLSLLSWILMIALGWSLMFYAERGSLMSSSGVLPDYAGTLWYVAYTMFTVGNGDFLPQADLWQVLSALVAFTGMGMVTLAVTYMLQIISALVNKRSLASQITSIAHTAEDFVIAQWTGNGFGAIELQLTSISSQLSTLNEQHLAYPILHYYHAQKSQKSTAVAIVILDDALTLLQECMEQEYMPNETITKSCRATIKSYLETLRSAYIQAADEVPDLPDWEKMKAAGVPICSKTEAEQRFRQHDERRKVLLGMNRDAAWKWPTELENG